MYQKRLVQNKIGMLKHLDALFGREAQLRAKIERVFQSVDNSPDGLVDEVAAKLWTHEDRSQLGRTVGSIEETLRSAIKNNIHKEDLVLEFEHNRVNIPINVSNYIRAACQKYKVEIPA